MILRTVSSLVLSLAFAGACRAQAVPTPSALLPADKGHVEQFVDSKMGPALRASGVPGAIVVVVRRGEILLTKGYGVSDAWARTPVDPARTLFNTASVGKTMTAILVGQLVDQGRLDLDADVNRYLRSVKVSGPRLTLRMLLGHRGALESNLTGLFVPIGEDTKVPARELGLRLRPAGKPGLVTHYDNQGYGLIGLVLRDVTGKSLPQLLAERLFAPAGMSGASGAVPPDGLARLARCHVVRGPGQISACPFWVYREALQGAGGALLSGHDMARYLQLLLNQGTLEGRQVLTPAAFADLVDFSHYRFHPGLPGFARAFTQFEEHRGLTYAHSGHMPGFSTMMTLYPDADIGIFVTFLGGTPGSYDSTVSGTVAALRDLSIAPGAAEGFATLNQLSELIAGAFIPANRARSSAGPVEGAGPDAFPDIRADRLAGRYVLPLDSTSFTERLASWMGAVTIESVSGGLRFAGPMAALGTYRKVGPSLYENAAGERIAFADKAGERYMAVHLSAGVFRKTDALRSPDWSVPLFGIAALLILSGLVQLRRGAPGRLRRLAATSLCGLLLVLAGLLAEWQWGISVALVQGALVLPALWRLMLHAGVLILLAAAWRFARDPRPLGWFVKAHGWLIAAACLAVLPVLLFWRVAGAFPPLWSW